LLGQAHTDESPLKKCQYLLVNTLLVVMTRYLVATIQRDIAVSLNRSWTLKETSTYRGFRRQFQDNRTQPPTDERRAQHSRAEPSTHSAERVSPRPGQWASGLTGLICWHWLLGKDRLGRTLPSELLSAGKRSQKLCEVQKIFPLPPNPFESKTDLIIWRPLVPSSSPTTSFDFSSPHLHSICSLFASCDQIQPR
jgi:hypothetical protein